MSRVLETVLTGRNLLSPVLVQAGRDVVAFNSTVAGANTKAATSATAAAQVQDRAADKITASNVKASTSASTSATTQARAHTQAAQSATLNARVQESANNALARSNGLLGASLSPLQKGLGATALAFGYAGYKGMEFDASMSRVQAATQATEADMVRLRESAIEMGADTQFSSTEAAAGITEMAKAGVSAENILAGGLKGALDLAAAGEMEVADAAEIGATALNVFKLEGTQMAHVADLLAAGAGKAQGSVHDLGMALNQSALVASATGLSIEETTGTLAAFASAGLIGSDAGTSFRSMLLHLQNPSKEAAGVMETLGINMYDANGAFVGMESLAGQLSTQMRGLTQAERDKAMATIFGSDAVRAANVLYEQGAQGIERWTGKVNDAGYAARQASQLNDNLRGDLERLGGAVDAFFTSAGEGAQGPLRELVQAFTTIVNVGGDLLGFWNSLPGPVQAAVVAVGAFAALRGPMAGFFTAMQVQAVLGTTAVLDTVLSVDKLRTGIVSLAAAGAGLAAAFAFAEAVGQVIEFTNAGDDAKTMVEGLSDSLDNLEGDARLKANAAAVKQLREELKDYQKIVDDYFAQNWFDEYIWKNPFSGTTEVADAQEAVRLLEAEINRLNGATDRSAKSTSDVAAGVSGLAESTGAAYGSIEAYAGVLGLDADATEELRTKTAELGETLAAFVDPLGAYTGLLEQKKEADRVAAEATAAATTSSSDSWKDYVSDVKLSFDEYMVHLEQQVTAQANWQTNMLQLAGRVSQGTLDELARMGPEGAPLVAELVNRSDAELDRFDDITALRSKEATDAWGAQLRLAAPVLAEVGKMAGQGVVNELAAKLQAGTTTVASIAAQYGVKLAQGINPVLAALGKPIAGVGGRLGGLNEYDVGGYTGPGRRNEPAGIVHRGEVVWSQEDVAAHGGPDRVESMRRSRNGYAAGGFVTAADVPRPYSTAPYGHPISTAGDAAMDSAYQATSTFVRENGPYGRALAWAQGQAGKPYIWAGVGPAGYDCSGFMSAITNVILGLSPHSRRGATASFPWAGFSPGYGQFTIGSTPNAGGGIGHMAGTLLGTNVESRGGEGVVIGPRARGASNGLFGTRAHLAMAGGGVIDEPVFGLGMWSGGSYSFGERGTETVIPGAPAAMPGYGMGGGWAAPAPRPVVVSLAGATVTGRFEFGSDGLVTLVDGRIDGALGQLHDDVHYMGG